jgi:hypothetical protein
MVMTNYSVSMFTQEGNTYGAEASDLGLQAGEVPRELGITHRSGVVTRFVFSHFEYDLDGDIVGFNYRSILGKATVQLYND